MVVNGFRERQGWRYEGGGEGDGGGDGEEIEREMGEGVEVVDGFRGKSGWRCEGVEREMGEMFRGVKVVERMMCGGVEVVER